MFEFVKKLVVRREVSIKVPQDGKEFKEATCFVTWEMVSNTDKIPLDQEFFKRNVKNIEGVVDAETKKPIDFTQEFLAEFVATSYVHSAFVREYMACTIGGGRGN